MDAFPFAMFSKRRVAVYSIAFFNKNKWFFFEGWANSLGIALSGYAEYGTKSAFKLTR